MEIFWTCEIYGVAIFYAHPYCARNSHASVINQACAWSNRTMRQFSSLNPWFSFDRDRILNCSLAFGKKLKTKSIIWKFQTFAPCTIEFHSTAASNAFLELHFIRTMTHYELLTKKTHLYKIWLTQFSLMTREDNDVLPSQIIQNWRNFCSRSILQPITHRDHDEK